MRLQKKRLQELATHPDVKPKENLVEVIVTVRFITDLDLEAATKLVTDQTNTILPDKRVEGHIKSTLVGLEDIRLRMKK